MIRFVLAQLRNRPRRALALLAGVLAATTGFTVLSGTATTAQVRTTGTVNANYRAAYDILVRPKGARTEIEETRGLIRPNYLAGQYGGISTDQLAKIRGVRNVSTAAPIAMLGYAMVELRQEIDLTDHVDRAVEHQVFRLGRQWVTDRGLTTIDDAAHFVYVTRNQLYRERFSGFHSGSGPRYSDGTALEAQPYPSSCYSTMIEHRADGRRQSICDRPIPVTVEDERTELHVTTLGADGKFYPPNQETIDPNADPSDPDAPLAPLEPRTGQDRLVVSVPWRVLVQVAAIDPEAEASLVGLDKAVVSGRYLTGADQPAVEEFRTSVPALFPDKPYLDESLTVTPNRLSAEDVERVVTGGTRDWAPYLSAVPGTPAGPPIHQAEVPRIAAGKPDLSVLFIPPPVGYDVDGSGTLRAKVVPPRWDHWTQMTSGDGGYPILPPAPSMDIGFRDMPQAKRMGEKGLLAASIGEFDPAKLPGFSPLAQVPMETYQSPTAVAADEQSRKLLSDKTMLPNSNPRGYLSSPPLVVTNLASLAAFPRGWEQREAPISSVRVRLDGITGLDAVSQERIRVTAGDIAAATGLDVDVTIGSSPSTQTVVLPGGDFGRPQLTLAEGWSHKGVAVSIVSAADQKSLVLFGLILLVCVLFLANAVAAAVRDRRTELGVLACLGWPARRLAAVVLGEVGLVGLVAGGLAAGLAVPIASLAGVHMSLGRALLAIPVGVGLALLAAGLPALSAARAQPGAAVAPAVTSAAGARRRRLVFSLAVVNLARVPGRTLLGVLALAVGVCALTMLIAVAVVFRNDVIGSMLGEAVAVRIRSVDVFAAAATAVLALVAVADVLYINVRERSGELAALWAGGWTDRSLTRLITYEGLGIGVLGSVLGAGAGLLGVSGFVGEINADLVGLAVLCAAVATVVAGLAAAVPALLLRRMSLATMLAEE